MEHISKAQIKQIRSLQHKKFRDELGLFVAEGDKCVEELRRAFELVLLVRTQESGIRSQESGDRSQDKTVWASRTEIEQMSSLETPQGVIGVFKKRSESHELTPAERAELEQRTDFLTLALDGIQNPGNLGTIIRTADWFGIRAIYCSPDTADCYNPKVVQATMGSLARVRIQYVDLPKMIESINEGLRLLDPKHYPLPVYGTLLDGRNLYDKGAILPDRHRGLIVMGNEGNGIRPSLRPLITHPICIPSYAASAPESLNSSRPESLNSEGPESLNSEGPESLNVAIATAIVLAEFRR